MSWYVGNDTPPVPGVYYYDWAVCMVCWPVIRADLAENDNTVKQLHKGTVKEGETEMTEKKREPQSRKGGMQKTHMQSDSVV